jgi:hypothetical protein
MNSRLNSAASLAPRHHPDLNPPDSPLASRGWMGEFEPFDDRPSDRGFVALLSAYRASGGLACGDDLACWMSARHRGDFASLARQMVAGEIFSFEWNEVFWVPMFQLEPRDLSVRPAPRQVASEFAPDCDGWLLSVWFVRPNSWLGDCAPLDLLASDLPAVLHAARADRYVMHG